MSKIDKQSDRANHAPEVDDPGSCPVAASPLMISVSSPVPAIEMRSKDGCPLPIHESRTTSRRAWLRRGVAVASPVVISLVSGPVYAAEGCILPSGFISQNTFDSRHPGGMVCISLSITFLSANVSSWPKTLQTAPFSTIFGGTPEVGMVPGKTTLVEVLKSGSDLSRYSIAAYLNAKMPTSSGFPLKGDDAIAIYKSYRGGAFSPLIVRGWSEGQTVSWLKMLIKP